MSHLITIDAGIFNKRILTLQEREYAQKAILYLLEGLVNVNREYLRNNPATPRLYFANVHYQREMGTETWKAIPVIYQDGYGDCEDLACARVAEQREKGIKCRPFLRWRRYQSFWLYHVLIAYPDNKMEDPSRILGMGKAES